MCVYVRSSPTDWVCVCDYTLRSFSIYLCWLTLTQAHHTHLYNSLCHFLIHPYVFASDFIEFTRAHTHTRISTHIYTQIALCHAGYCFSQHTHVHFLRLLKQPWINSRFLYYYDNMNITLCLFLFKTSPVYLPLSLSLCVSLQRLCVIAVFLYRRIIIGWVLKWHFHDGKNEKYCQLLYAVKMGASGHNNKHTTTFTRTPTERKTRGLTDSLS